VKGCFVWANGSEPLERTCWMQIRPNHWLMSAFAGLFLGAPDSIGIRVCEFWPLPGESANGRASVGLPRRSLVTFFGLGKKVTRRRPSEPPLWAGEFSIFEKMRIKDSIEMPGYKWIVPSGHGRAEPTLVKSGLSFPGPCMFKWNLFMLKV
jgi:hypothetical protein